MSKNSVKLRLSLMSYMLVAVLVLFLGNAESITVERPLYSVTATVALDYSDVDADTPMGYVLLSKMSNAENLLNAYDAIDDGLSKRAESIDLSSLNLTATEIANVMDACTSDHPEYFWIDSTNYTYFTYGGTSIVDSVAPSYIMTQSEITAAKRLIEAEAADILDEITDDMSDYQIEKYIHDTLAMSIDYKESVNDGTIYGALVLDECVCEGYARTFQYLLNLAGVEAYYVTGASASPSTGSVIGHAWNLVEIDNCYYYVDLTWDDQGSSPADVFYPYFNVTKEYISKDHTFSPLEGERGKDYYAYLPDATATTNNYYVRNSRTISMSTITVNQVANLIKNPLDGAARAFFDGNKEALISWWSNNCVDVATKVGIDGAFIYGYLWMGDEFQFMLSEDGDINVETPGPITIEINDSYKVYASVVTQNTGEVTLVWSSDNTGVAVVDSTGNVIAKAAGSATITITSGDFSKEVVFYVREATPTASVSGGYLVNLVPNAKYAVSYGSNAPIEYVADSQGRISVLDAWRGSDIKIVKLNNDSHCNSASQSLAVPLDSSGTTHTHSYANYTSNNDATCTADGTKTGKCACGAENTVTDKGSKKPHTPIAVPEVPATPTAVGTTAGHKCKDCGTVLDGCTEIPKLAPIEVAKAADGNWYSYRNGVKVDYTGFATNDNGTWYVENGKVTFKKNDIIKDTDGTWKYVVNSKFTKTNTVAKNSLGWWRVENGIVNFKATGIYKNDLGWWRVVNGKVDFSATGVYQNELGWWYCKNGKVDFGYTGIKSNSNGWWRIVNGKVDFSANGVYQNENGWWKVENGKVNFGFTGIASNSNGRWYCVNGKVDFSKNGRVYYAGKYYTVKGGKVV